MSAPPFISELCLSLVIEALNASFNNSKPRYCFMIDASRSHPTAGRVASGTRSGQGALRLLRCASALRVTGRVPAAQMPLWAVFDGLWLDKGGAESAPRNRPQIYQGRLNSLPIRVRTGTV